jgi:hypothetical protein
MGFQCQLETVTSAYHILMYRSRSAFNFVMFYIMMLQSSWFILNKRLIADYYTLQEMWVYQQNYFSS